MTEFSIPDEMREMLERISTMQNEQQRQAITMLAGFIATGETDIDYMDAYVDPLYDFVDPGSDTEEIIRKYIAYISTFDANEGKERLDDLEDSLGYKNRIVLTAGLLAQELHAGQKDKGGNDYFESHLLKVGNHGHSWKEKVVGFLHDAAEDTPNSVEDVVRQLITKIELVTSTPIETWWQDWMKDYLVYENEITHPLTSDEIAELKTALELLNNNTAANREEYISRLYGNQIAINVKLNDLESNMDISRIPNPTDKDHQRIARYGQERQQLYGMLNKMYPILEK